MGEYAVFTTAVATLKARAQVADREEWYVEGQLDVILSEAAFGHNTAYTFTATTSTLPAREESLVRILAFAEVMNVRAAAFALQASTSGGGGVSIGTDRNAPYYKCMDMRDKLLVQYQTACRQLGITASSGVKLGMLATVDYALTKPGRERSPFNVVPAAIIGGQANISSGVWVVEWELPPFQDLKQLVLFYDLSTVSMREAWNNESLSGYPQIRDGLVPKAVITDQSRTSLKLTGLGTTGSHRVMLVTMSVAGQYAYSNEYVVIT